MVKPNDQADELCPGVVDSHCRTCAFVAAETAFFVLGAAAEPEAVRQCGQSILDETGIDNDDFTRDGCRREFVATLRAALRRLGEDA